MKRIILLLFAAALFGSSIESRGQSVQALADQMYNAGMKAVYESTLFQRDFKGLYNLAYKDIYQSGNKTPIAYFYMGACLELGMGTSEVSQYKAQAHYQEGARRGSSECKQRLRDINSSGWWGATAANREAFAKRYGRPGTTGGGSTGGGYAPSRNNTYKCSSCNGTGNCEFCGGSGWHYNKYNGYNYPCNSCNKTGRCAKCKGSGKL